MGKELPRLRERLERARAQVLDTPPPQYEGSTTAPQLQSPEVGVFLHDRDPEADKLLLVMHPDYGQGPLHAIVIHFFEGLLLFCLSKFPNIFFPKLR